MWTSLLHIAGLTVRDGKVADDDDCCGSGGDDDPDDDNGCCKNH